MSVAAISDYLGKVKRRSLVLKECLNTVPSDVGAVRELLNYGLLETGKTEGFFYDVMVRNSLLAVHLGFIFLLELLLIGLDMKSMSSYSSCSS